MGMSNGTRGDGYMYSLEPLLATIPRASAEGNHELEGASRGGKQHQDRPQCAPTTADPPPTARSHCHRAGSPFGVYCPAAEFCEGRYLNQTAGYLVAGRASGSGTNRYYSLDVGLVHLVVYNTMQYLGLGADMRAAQLAWLEADLKKASAPAQRARVPWIVVASESGALRWWGGEWATRAHPLTSCHAHALPLPAHIPMYCSAEGQTGVGGDSRKDIEPLLLAAGVDLYLYGHVHSYEASWPVGPNGTVVAQSYVNARAPVHVLAGAGGPPGGPDVYPASRPAWSRATYSSWSYGRLQVFNATHLTYSQHDNVAGAVVDSFTLVQEKRAEIRY